MREGQLKKIFLRQIDEDLKLMGKPAYFVDDRNNFLETVRSHFTGDCVLLLMGARDPSLEIFAIQVWKDL